MAEAQTDQRDLEAGTAALLFGGSGGGDPQGRDLAVPGSPNEVHWGGAKGNELVTTPRDGGGGGDHVKQIFRDALKAELPGISDAALDGITRRIGVESGWNTRAVGDNGTSFGLPQWHGPRAAEFQRWTGANNLDPSDPAVQAKRVAYEFKGGDPQSARALPALMHATSADEAYSIFTSSFERPAGSPGSEETNLRSTATGEFSGQAKALVQQALGRMNRDTEGHAAAMAEAKDMRSFERAAMAKWLAESDKPPANMHENWSQWGSIAQSFALIGSLFGRRTATAALGAAGEMMESANAADVKSYDAAYKRWQTHNDGMLKAVELFHKQYQEIIEADDKSWDHKQAEITTLLSAAGVVSRFDEQTFARQEQALRIAKDRADIVKAQNEESDIRLSVEAKDKAWQDKNAGQPVPPDVHSQHVGEAKHERSGTGVAAGVAMSDDDARFAARQYLAGDRSVLSGLGYGNTGAQNRAKVRSAIRAEAEAQGMSPADVATTIAEFEGLKAGERTLGQVGARADRAVFEANNMADLVTQYSDAFPRTEFVPLNRARQAVASGTGDTRIVQFNAAVNSFINAYARAISPTGQATISDKDHAREMLETAMTPDQVRAVVGVLKQEMQLALRSTGQGAAASAGWRSARTYRCSCRDGPAATPRPTTFSGMSIAASSAPRRRSAS
jgi:hypothetical protein